MAELVNACSKVEEKSCAFHKTFDEVLRSHTFQCTINSNRHVMLSLQAAMKTLSSCSMSYIVRAAVPMVRHVDVQSAR